MPDFTLTPAQQQELMRAALAEARRGAAEDEVPIGAVIARWRGGAPRIVARGHNRVNALRRKTAHAETVAFENAAADDGAGGPLLPPDAEDGILVSTLEPCVMCLGAAMEAGVPLVLYGLGAPADGGARRVTPPESPESKSPQLIGGILPAESRRLFGDWLRGKENTEQAKFVQQLLALTE